MPRAPLATDWLSLFALTVFWGSAFLFNELALRSLPPTALVAARTVIAALFLFTVLLASGGRLPRTLAGWRPMLVTAVFGTLLPMQLIAWGQQFIGSGETGVLMAVMPVFLFTLAHFFLPSERLTPARIGGFFAGFAGVVLVIGPESLTAGLGSERQLGSAAIHGDGMCYSINTVYARRLGPMNPMSLAAGMTLIASLLLAPAGAASWSTVSWPLPPMALGAVVVLGLICSGFASWLYFRLVQGPGPVFLSLTTYLVPAWAVIVGAVVLREPLEPSVLGGLALILSGVAISEWRAAPRRGAVPSAPAASTER
ncbi:MAG: DMT family transporter [Gammaproteobacteria bacterium]